MPTPAVRWRRPALFSLHHLAPKARKNNVLGGVLAYLVMLLVVAAIAIGLVSSRRANAAAANASTPATQIQIQCPKEPFLLDQRGLCQKSDQVAQDTADLVPGAQGPEAGPESPGVNGSTDGTSRTVKMERYQNCEPGPAGTDGAKDDSSTDGTDGEGIAEQDGKNGQARKTAVDASGNDEAPGEDSTVSGPA